MDKFIKVNLECIVDNGLPDVLDDVVEKDLEWRSGFINISCIVGLYLRHDGNGTLISLTTGELWLVSEDYGTIMDKILLLN